MDTKYNKWTQNYNYHGLSVYSNFEANMLNVKIAGDAGDTFLRSPSLHIADTKLYFILFV